MTRLHGALAAAAALLAGAAAAADLVSPRAPERRAAPQTAAFISAPELAERIMRGDTALRLFDLRPGEAYAQFHIPTAVQAAPDELAGASVPAAGDVVLYGDDRAVLSTAIRTLQDGHDVPVRVLREGVAEWLGRVHEPRLAQDATPAERAQFDRAAAMSRFFGGMPLSGVPRAEVPAGYWTGAPRSDELLAQAALQSVTMLRRRGC